MKRVRKYSLGAFAAGVIVVAPIVTIVTEKEGKSTFASYASGSYANVIAPQPNIIKEPTGKTQITTTIDASNFSFSGTNYVATVNFKRPTTGTGMTNLTLYYATTLGPAANWSTTLPKYLINGDVVYARLAVTSNANSFEIDKNILAITVSGLPPYPIANPAQNGKLDASYFSFLGPDGQTSIYLNNYGLQRISYSFNSFGSGGQVKSPGIDDRIQIVYSKNNSDVWTPTLSGLKNTDVVQAKFAAKPEWEGLLTVSPGTVSINVANRLPVTDASFKNKALDFNDLTFSGNNASGSVTYDGYNKDEYNVQLKRTSSFVSGWTDRYFYLNFDQKNPTDKDNPYAANLYTNGKDDSVYKYLPATRLIANTTQGNRSQVIRSFEPFILQRPSPIKHASFAYYVYDPNPKRLGDGKGDVGLDAETYFSGIVEANITRLQIDVDFNDDGSVKSATSTPLDVKGQVMPNVQPTVLWTGTAPNLDPDGTLISTNVATGDYYGNYGNGKGSAEREFGTYAYNVAYILVDDIGNIATAMAVQDPNGGQSNVGHLYNGMLVSTTINNVTYADGSTWSTDIKKDLINGEYVSAYPVSANAAIPAADYKTKGLAMQVQNLAYLPAEVTPGIDPTWYSFDKTSGDMKMDSSQSTLDHANKVNLLYSTDGITFSSTMPKGLFNHDVIFVQQSLKPTRVDLLRKPPYISDPTVIMVTASGIDKRILQDTITPEDFQYATTANSGSASLIKSKTLPKQVQLQFGWDEKGTYSNTSPANLKNDDKLWARLVIKPDLYYFDNYLLTDPGYQPIQLTVSGLGLQRLNDKIVASDFLYSGTHESGTTPTRRSTLPALAPQVKVQYSIDATNTTNGTYTDDVSTLKNGQKIYARLVVKPEFTNNYDLAPANRTPIALTVSGLDKKGLLDQVVASDFDFPGKPGSGSVTLNGNKVLSPQVQVSYSTTENGNYGPTPTNLKENDPIWARLSIKSGDAQNYDLSVEAKKPVALIVTGLGKTELKDSLLSSDFTLGGDQGSGTYTYTPATAQSPQVEVTYAKSQAGPFSAIMPTDLRNGDKLYVALGIIDDANNYRDLYKFASKAVTSLVLDVNNLPKNSLPDTIVATDFSFSGVHESGTVNLSKNLSPQVEVQYGSSQTGTFSATAPTDLKNGDPLYAKLAIKSGFENDFELPANATDPVALDVKLSPKELTDTIDENDFTYVNKPSGGQPQLDKKTLSPQVELLYSDQMNNQYTKDVPPGLKNGDKVYVKIGIKPADAANYVLSSGADSPIELTVDGLGKTVLPDKIDSSNFEFTGTHQSGDVSLRQGVNISSQVELQYSLNETSGFSASVPTNLSNNDTIYAKLVLKPGEDLNYELMPNADAVVTLQVSGLAKKQLSDTLAASDFGFSGTQESGTVETAKVTSPEAEIQYSRTADGTYSSVKPSDLKTGETIYAKLVVLTPDNFELKPGAGDPLPLVVSQLDPKTLPDFLSENDFGFSGNNSFGQVELKNSKSLSNQVELLYSLDGSTYSATAPTGLKNGDKVYFKLSVKQGEEANYALDANSLTAINLEVTNLRKTVLPDSIKASDFIPTGIHESGSLSLDPALQSSPQVEIEYAKTIDGAYSAEVPTDLKNNDTIYARLAIKGGEEDFYALAPGAEDVVTIVVNGLKKKPLDQTVLSTDFSFKGITLNSAIDFVKQLMDQVEVLYSSSENGVYRPVAPTFLKNGETLWVKTSVKAPYDANYTIDPVLAGPHAVMVSGLAKSMIDLKPEASSFSIARDSAANKISVVASAPGGGVSYEYGYPDADGKVLAWSKDAPTSVPSQEIYVRLVANDPSNYEVSPEILVLNAPEVKEAEKPTPIGYAAVTLGSLIAFGLVSRLALGIYRRFWKK